MLHKDFLMLSLQQKQLLRVTQKNLVYVTGIDPNISLHELEQNEFFGQYGKIQRITPNKIQGSSQVYILFENQFEALDCILSISGSFLYGRSIKAQFGTSKYCTHYLQNSKCQISECPFLHDFVNYVQEEEQPTLPEDRELFLDNKKQTKCFPPSWNRIQKPQKLIKNKIFNDNIFLNTAKKISSYLLGSQLVITGCK